MAFFNSVAVVLAIEFLAISADSVIPKNPVEQQILLLLNKWHEGAVQTNLFPLPSLQKIDINKIDSYYNGRGIKITFSIDNMTLTGLQNFTVQYLNVTQSSKDIRISAKLFVPVLTLRSESYKLKGRAYMLYPLTGSGKFWAIIRNVDVSISVHFVNVGDTRMQIDDFVLEFKIDKVDANLEKSSWPINQVLNREGVDIIEGYHDGIVNSAWSYVVPYVNKHLATISPGGFLKTIADISANSYVIRENNK